MTRDSAKLLIEKWKQCIIADVEPDQVQWYGAEVEANLCIALEWLLSDDPMDRLVALNMITKKVYGDNNG